MGKALHRYPLILIANALVGALFLILFPPGQILAAQPAQRIQGRSGPTLSYADTENPVFKTARKHLPRILLPLSTVVASPEEHAALQRILNEPNATLMIALGERFLMDWNKSKLLPVVYTALAQSFREKNDYERVVENAEKSIALDPDNVMALAIVAHTLPKRPGENGLETALKLSRSTRYAQKGLELVEVLPNPVDVSAEEFEESKNYVRTMLHSSLGLVYLQRGMSTKSQEEYEIAISLASPPDPQDYFRLGEAYTQGYRPEEINYTKAIEAYGKASQLAPNTIIDQVATERIQSLTKTQDNMKFKGK